MIIEVPVLSFTRIHAEPGAAGYMYALRAKGMLYVTQRISRLAREALYQVYNSTVSISLQELNDLVREHGGASIITSCPDREIDVTSVHEQHAAPL